MEDSISMFTGLPQTPKPWKSVACSFLLQAAGVAAILAIGLLPHQEIVRQSVTSYIPLTAPTPDLQQPEPEVARPVVRPETIQSPPPKVIAKLSVPTPRMRAPEPVTPPEVQLQAEEFVPVAPREVRPQAPRVVQTGSFANESAPVTASAPKATVETGAFSTGSSATPNTNLPPQKVQTGGFGDPNGAAPSKNSRKSGVQMARLGGFDLPPGEGQGNGTGGASGQRGVVASSGFGNGVATTNPGKGRATQTTQAAGFGEAQAAAKAPQIARKASVKTPQLTGVEILHKPNPEYTEEARRLGIEGEVLLEVVFSASGDLRIVRVVRGLGHGLDEAAVRAAERVRFKPAMKEGRAVDARATLHIVFQLA